MPDPKEHPLAAVPDTTTSSNSTELNAAKTIGVVFDSDHLGGIRFVGLQAQPFVALGDDGVGSITIGLGAANPDAVPYPNIQFYQPAPGQATIRLIADRIGEFGNSGTAQSGAIANAAGGLVIDAEARSALNTLLAYFRLRGTVAT